MNCVRGWIVDEWMELLYLFKMKRWYLGFDLPKILIKIRGIDELLLGFWW